MAFRSAAIHPLLKNLKSPKLFLYFFSKTLESLKVSRLFNYIDLSNLDKTFYFGFNKNHCTKTIILNVINFTLCMATFDACDYSILLHRLHINVGQSHTTLNWFPNFLFNHFQPLYSGAHFKFVSVYQGAF